MILLCVVTLVKSRSIFKEDYPLCTCYLKPRKSLKDSNTTFPWECLPSQTKGRSNLETSATYILVHNQLLISTVILDYPTSEKWANWIYCERMQALVVQGLQHIPLTHKQANHKTLESILGKTMLILVSVRTLMYRSCSEMGGKQEASFWITSC